ncbi:unnamed protein product [Porites lobata]|uniref:P/Homo B domain-containing protein n=1 Tax=Porites lobata TaxID=104759 RepID=A0ABN8QX62_9CNID|nr:unnamed protein product [Porites lobata]
MSLLFLIYLCGGVILQADRSTSTNQNSWKKWQWYLKDTAVSMNVKPAWDANYTGKGILVAVVDDGVKIDHPDLSPNMNLTASYDFLESRPINIRRHNPGNHGTKCAGVIVGAESGACGKGVAYDAQISGIRIYTRNRRSTDRSEAQALSFQRDIVDIYSNSWGPGDMGWQVKGPGPSLKEVLEKGVQLGRNGKGSIFVFSAGNGGISGDSCAFNGYVNSIHTIAISAVNWDGSLPHYTERCASIMAVTYGQDMFPFGNIVPPMVTTQGSSGCTEIFPGTSATAAMGSGIIALVLQANPKLTWRDVQHIIVRAAKPITSANHETRWRRDKPSWNRNSAGLLVSSDFGFGLMDARKMIAYAKKWRTVPQQLTCEVQLNATNFSSSRLVIPWRGDLRLTLSLKQENCNIQYLEHMQAEVNLLFPRRGYLEMFSTSPSGTRSKLLYSRKIDVLTGRKNLTDWRVTSLHYWGEKPFGNWNFTIRSARPWSNLGAGRVFGLKIILFGTSEDPLQGNKHVNRKMKREAISNIREREKDIPIHGGYSQWSYWGRCSRSCEGGLQYRHRYCNNPRPRNDGRDCSGNAREGRRCNTYRCPVHGGFSPWRSWSRCSVTCGGGLQRRSRTCTNPRPAYGGRQCFGAYVQSQRCALNRCPPVDGGHSPWTRWSLCSVTCNNGTQQRFRTCTNPPPANGGEPCAGESEETKACINPTCPETVRKCFSVPSRSDILSFYVKDKGKLLIARKTWTKLSIVCMQVTCSVYNNRNFGKDFQSMVSTHPGAPGLPVLGHALEEISDAHVIVLIHRRQTEGETAEDQLNK